VSAGASGAAGRVVGIYVGPAGLVEQATAIAGRGLEGDRYFAGTGFFYRDGKLGQDITLVEAEALEALANETGIVLSYTDARRNIVTRGIRLNDLVGKRFRIGDVECFGQRLCPPCAHLQELTEPGVLRGLVHRGGLRADIVGGGEIALGSVVAAL
jgi:MOSC domain-containing protein YiiM